MHFGAFLYMEKAALNVIICSDIFGQGPHLQTLLDEIDLKGQCKIFDPYNGQEQNFNSESDAYQAFTSAGGVEGYIERLKPIMAEADEAINLVGFSAGAVAAYVAINQMHLNPQSRLFGFYPGQIRHYLDMHNRYSCRMIFPKFERHFDLAAVCKELNRKKGLSQEHTDYMHGFMNPLSEGFSDTGYQEYRQRLSAWLNQADCGEAK